MKKAYKAPKAMMIDFIYDEQIRAESAGDWGKVGDPDSVGLCQQMDPTRCRVFWMDGSAALSCKADPIPWSLR